MAAGLTSALGVSLDVICEGLESLKAVPGRLESIENDKGINVIVDYAHSPDALLNVLHALRPVTQKRLITVFGCGGNRSHEKRPVMGRTAVENSDVVIVTSDNPRKEDPQTIVNEIMSGINSVGIPEGKSVSQIVDRREAIISALSMAEAGDTVLIAGKGHEIGINFEEIKIIIDGCEHQDRLGVCLDTCHINDAGYDVSDFDHILDEFDKIVGLDRLLCVHVNDTKNPMGTHKDRHENIGYGYLGFDTLYKVVHHPKLNGIPKILETPYYNEKAPYKQEIEMLRSGKYVDNWRDNL